MAVTQAFSRELSDLIPVLPGHVDNQHLTGGGAAETVTVPASATAVIFSPYPKSADFLVNTVGGTATRPSADVTNGSASVPNPLGFRGLTPAGTFSMIAGTADLDVALIWARERKINS